MTLKVSYLVNKRRFKRDVPNLCSNILFCGIFCRHNAVMFVLFQFYSGAPAGAEGARGRSSIPIEIGEPIKPRKFGCHVRPYVRTHGLGLGTSLSLSLIWSPSLANSHTKTFFGLSRVNLFVVEIC